MANASDTGTPLPATTGESAPFFDGARAGKLMLQRCSVCGTFMFPVHARCVECFADGVAWVEANGRATLYSYAIMHTAYPRLERSTPYNIVLVELEEGVRMLANVVGCADDELAIGMPLRVLFEELSPGISIPRFRPAD